MKRCTRWAVRVLATLAMGHVAAEPVEVSLADYAFDFPAYGFEILEIPSSFT